MASNWWWTVSSRQHDRHRARGTLCVGNGRCNRCTTHDDRGHRIARIARSTDITRTIGTAYTAHISNLTPNIYTNLNHCHCDRLGNSC